MALSDEQFNKLQSLSSKPSLTDSEMGEMEQLYAASQAPTSAPVQAPNDRARPQLGAEASAPGNGASFGKQALQMGGEMALEAGAATAGQAAGILTGPAAIIAVPTFGGLAALSANIVNQKRRAEQKGFNYGEAVSAFIGGAIPGATMAKASGGAVAKFIKPVARELTANLAAAEAQSIIDNGRALTPKEATAIAAVSITGSQIARKLDDGKALKAINAERVASAPLQQFVSEAVKDGYQVWPSASKFSKARVTAEQVGNPKMMQLGMAAHNYEKAVNDVRAELGMFKQGVPMPLTQEAIQQVRSDYNGVYAEVGRRTGMEAEVAELTQLRNDANFNWKRFEAAEGQALFDVSDRYKQAFQTLSDKAQAIEDSILASARQVDPELPKKFLDTRKAYAKSYALEYALDPVLGFDPSKLARWQKLRAGQELTDKMGTIAKMSEKFPDIMMGPQAISGLQNSIRSQAPNVSSLMHAFGPVVRPALTNRITQNAAASQPYRLRLNSPSAYTSPMSEATLQASRAAGRQVPLNSYLAP